MSISGIQGQPLEVTVVGCTRLKDTEWISRQDPYVCVEYGSTKFRTRTCTDGHKTPTFQEKFVFTLIEGLREINVSVWNSNTLSFDDFIGSGKVQLGKVLSQGFDDNSWTLQSRSGRYAGEARLILHYANAGKQTSHSVPSAPPYASHTVPQPSLYSTPPPVSTAPYGVPATSYPTATAYSAYPPPPPSTYPPSMYPPPPPAAYPPPPYPPASVYPPPPYPPPHGAPHFPPGPYPGHHPPPY